MIVTLGPDDPKFNQYLRGTFSRTQRALPVRSLNVSSNRERVTFEILSLSELRGGVSRRRWLVKAWSEAIRPWTLILSGAPILLTTITNLESLNAMWALSVLSVLFLHLSANLLNDYSDHLKGVDRLNPRSGTRVIQKGWLAAYQIRRAGLVLVGFAILFSLPVLVCHFSMLVAISLVTSALMLKFTRLEIKYRKMGESILFLLFGPLLTLSLSFVSTGVLSTKSLLIGVWTGISAAHIYFLRALENVMVDEQSGQLTWAARAGFDQAKPISVGLSVTRVLAVINLSLYFQRPSLALLSALVETLFQFKIALKLKHSSSPLSSQIRGLHTLAWKGYAVMALILVLGLWI